MDFWTENAKILKSAISLYENKYGSIDIGEIEKTIETLNNAPETKELVTPLKRVLEENPKMLGGIFYAAGQLQ